MKLPSIKRLAQDSDLALLTVLTLIFAPIMDDEGLAWTHLLANTLNANDYDYIQFNLGEL
jgi:hypothetical protein